jgi:hypothetical protein
MLGDSSSCTQENQSSGVTYAVVTTFNVVIALGSATPFLCRFKAISSSPAWIFVAQLCVALIAIAVIWFLPSRYSIFHGRNIGRLDRDSEPDPVLCLAGVWAPPALTLLAYYEHVEIADHLPVVLAACVAGGLLFACAGARDRTIWDDSGRLPLVVGVLLSLIWGYAIALDVNCVLDRSKGVVHKTMVLAKVSPGRGQPYLLLNAWGPEAENGKKVVVAHEVYNSVEVSGTVCAVLRQGFLGAPWYTVETCPWNEGPVLFWGSNSRNVSSALHPYRRDESECPGFRLQFAERLR